PIGNRLEVLDARDGTVLAQFAAEDLIWSGAAPAADMVFFGSYDQNLYALRLNPDAIVPPDPSAPPTGLQAQPMDQAVQWSWVERSPAVGRFLVQRKVYRQGIQWETIAPVTETRFTDRTAANGTIYEYRVRAEFPDGAVSEPSNIVAATPSAGVS